jgi:alpha-1,6-mannosyltransferase
MVGIVMPAILAVRCASGGCGYHFVVSSLTPALGLPARVRGRSVVAGVLLGTLVASTAIFGLLAASPGHMLIRNPGHVVLPDWFTGPLADLGLHTTAGREAWALIAICAAYLAMLPFATRLRPRHVVIAVVGLNLLFALAPPLLSSDVFSYIAYGRIGALHGLDPYKVTPMHLPGDPVYDFVGWRRMPTIYGPLFTLGTYPLGLVSVSAALWSFKALACLSSLALVALVWRLAEEAGRPGGAAAAVVGLNPILLIWAVGGAHNDLLMMAVLLAGILLVVRARPLAGGATLGAAVAIKITAGFALPFVLIGAARRGRVLGGIALIAMVSALVAVFAFPDHALNLIQTFKLEQRLVALHGIPNELTNLFGQPRLTHSGLQIARAVFLIAIAGLLVRVVRTRDWIGTIGWVMVALVTTSAWFVPWYTIWPLPFAAITRDRRLLAAVLALQAFVMWNVLPKLLAQ